MSILSLFHWNEANSQLKDSLGNTWEYNHSDSTQYFGIDVEDKKFGNSAMKMINKQGGIIWDCTKKLNKNKQFTVECWAICNGLYNFDSSTGNETSNRIFSILASDGKVISSFYLTYSQISQNAPIFTLGRSWANTVSLDSTWDCTRGTWRHYAIVFGSTDIKVFINGTLAGTMAGSANDLLLADDDFTTFRIGNGYIPSNTDASYNNFVIDEFCITEGAKYTANFTSPDSEFIFGEMYLDENDDAWIYDKYNRALLHFDDDIIDKKGNTWTYSGVTPVFVEGKFGKALQLNTNDKLTVAESSVTNFNNKEARIEFWFYIPSSGGTTTWNIGSASSGKSPIMITGYYDSTQNKNCIKVSISKNLTSWDLDKTCTTLFYANDVWNHLTVNIVKNVYSTGTCVTLNGVVEWLNYIDYTTSLSAVGDSNFGFGGALGVSQLNGLMYVDELYIGDNPYFYNFTPPTRPFFEGLANVINGFSTATDETKLIWFNAADRVVSPVYLKQLGKFKILTYTQDSTPINYNIIAVPKPQKIKLKTETVSITAVPSILSEFSGTGDVKIAVMDSSVKLYKCVSGVWSEISDLVTEGMTLAEVEALTSIDWNNFAINHGNKIGFQYMLSKEVSTDSAKIGKFNFNRSDLVKYGVTFDGTSSTGTRMYDAVGLNFTPSTSSAAGTDDFSNLAPFNIRECITQYNSGTGKRDVLVYKDEDSATYNSLVSAKTGNVMVEFPKFWYSRPNRYEIIISPIDLVGFKPSPMHYRNGKMWNKARISKYALSSSYTSCSNQTIMLHNTVSLETATNQVRLAGQYILDYAAWCSLQMLALVKYNCLDTQSVVAFGLANESNYNTTTGLADSVKGLDGSLTSISASEAMVAFGIENLWGNTFTSLAGVVVSNDISNGNSYVYINTDIENLTTYPTVSTIDTDTSWIKIATPLGHSPTPNKEFFYQSDLVYDTNCDWALYPSGSMGDVDNTSAAYNTSQGLIGDGCWANYNLTNRFVNKVSVGSKYFHKYASGLFGFIDYYNPINLETTDVSYSFRSFELAD